MYIKKIMLFSAQIYSKPNKVGLLQLNKVIVIRISILFPFKQRMFNEKFNLTANYSQFQLTIAVACLNNSYFRDS